MIARIHTVAFQGIDVLNVEVQVQMSSGFVSFIIVGLPDKTIAESRERVRAAFYALGLSLPAKRIIVNLAPADVNKEGTHFDLPIALSLLVSMGILSAEQMQHYSVLGELALDGSLTSVSGVLPAAINAKACNLGLICPQECGSEAVWAGDIEVIAAPSLLILINHLKGQQLLPHPSAQAQTFEHDSRDLYDIKGQETAKRLLEITASGGHNLLMIGPPGAGKSMLASRLPSLLPPLEPAESLEVSMIHSVAGLLKEGRVLRCRPFRDPHHSASLPSLVGGGQHAKPGEISLAHNGILFLDELPEFARQSLEALRQPLETGRVIVARANHHISYPARVQLIAAMNPCRCGYLDNSELACSRAPKCALQYQERISGPLFDRIDCHIDVPMVKPSDLTLAEPRERTSNMARRIAQVRAVQAERYHILKVQGIISPNQTIRTNANVDGELLENVAKPDQEGQNYLLKAVEQLHLSARGYYRILRVARTLADMQGSSGVHGIHIKEALHYRRIAPGR